MVDNSREAFLQRLSQGDVMNGWGAILALGREQLDQLLKARFLESYAQSEFLAPISGRYFTDGQRSDEVVLDGLVLGPPRVSFAGVTEGSAKVTVSMPFIAGEYCAYAKLVGQPPQLNSSHGLREEMGYHVQMSVELKEVRDSALDQVHLLLDLNDATAYSSNLGDSQVARIEMGSFIKKHIDVASDAFKRSFVLFSAELNGSDALTVAGLGVRTMAAPEGAGSPQDGAAIIMMQLRGRRFGGTWPAPGKFPYPLPDGSAGVTLLVEQLLANILQPYAENLLARMSVAGQWSIKTTEHLTPFDQLLFGSLAPSSGRAHVEPGMARLVSGQALDFKLGSHMAPSWVARNISSPRSTGSIDGKGRYLAAQASHFARENQVVLVSAELPSEDLGIAPSALVIESLSGLAVSPRVQVWRPHQPAVELVATGHGEWSWSLIPEASDDNAQSQVKNHGQLQDLGGGRARFTPDQPGTSAQVLLQRIRATDDFTGEHAEATVIILSYPATLNVVPFHSGKMPWGNVRFALEGESADGWKLFGEGALDEGTGVYSPPASPTSQVAVVMAIIARRYVGYGIIELMRENAQMALFSERYRTVRSFTLTPAPAHERNLYANGLQQLAVDIEIETNDFTNSDGDTVADPVSDLELSTLKILAQNGQPIEYLVEQQEGLPPDSVAQWGWSRTRNRYDYYPTSGGVAPLVRTNSEAIVRLRVYLQTTEAETRKLHASFTGFDLRQHNSRDISKTLGEVEVTGRRPPVLSANSYVLEKPRRAAASGGKTVRNDNFNYYQYTTDYWNLIGYSPVYRDLRFYQITASSRSMIRYESEQLDETFCSYTSLALNPVPRPGSAPRLVRFEHEASLELLTLEPAINYYHRLDYDFKPGESLGRGALLISLDRVSDLPFWHDGMSASGEYRTVLDQPMALVLTDQHGNPHPLRIGFGPRGTMDSRNTLTLVLDD